jgi:hypothetical protein
MYLAADTPRFNTPSSVDAERVLFDWAHANADAEEAAFDLEDRQAPPQEDVAKFLLDHWEERKGLAS